MRYLSPSVSLYRGITTLRMERDALDRHGVFGRGELGGAVFVGKMFGDRRSRARPASLSDGRQCALINLPAIVN